MPPGKEQWPLAQPRRRSLFLWPPRRRRVARRKPPTVRLGQKRRGWSLAGAFRRIRLRWLRLHYLSLLRKLKTFYSSLVRDLIEAGATMEVIQSRIMMETSFSVPVIPGAGIPSHVSA